MTLDDLVKSKKWPKEWVLTLPHGHRMECRVVSRSYMQKLNASMGGGKVADGLSCTFGDKVLDKMLPDKTARAYFDSSMSVERFAHVYFHETLHIFIEWTGERHAELLDVIAKAQC